VQNVCASQNFVSEFALHDYPLTEGDILHKGDFVAQCKYAYNKIKRALEKNGATLADVVRITTYLTDIRNQADYGQCRREVFGTSATPAGTLVSINQLAWPGMMLEVDVIAVMPAEK
jgi:enamine deaminase RidA (YjgF/YER057c/UK114 family)